MAKAGLEVTPINKVAQGGPHIVDAMKSGEVDLVFNTTEGEIAIADSLDLRRAALFNKIPYYTTVAGTLAAVEAIVALKSGTLEVSPLQFYFSGSY